MTSEQITVGDYDSWHDAWLGTANRVAAAGRDSWSAVGVAVLGTVFLAGSFGVATSAMVVALMITFGLVFLLPGHAREGPR